MPFTLDFPARALKKPGVYVSWSHAASILRRTVPASFHSEPILAALRFDSVGEASVLVHLRSSCGLAMHVMTGGWSAVAFRSKKTRSFTVKSHFVRQGHLLDGSAQKKAGPVFAQLQPTEPSSWHWHARLLRACQSLL